MRLSRIGIKSHHVKRQPRRYGTRIVNSRNSARRSVAISIYNFSCSVWTQILAANPVIHIGTQKRRFIGHIIKSLLEQSVESMFKSLFSISFFHQFCHIVRNTQGTFPRTGFVKKPRHQQTQLVRSCARDVYRMELIFPLFTSH
jgi:hypothetical protein